MPLVGRLVLMHQPDPAAMLRRLARVMNRDGIMAFQELDISGARSFPPSPIFDRCLEWIAAAFTKTGTDTRMGVQLYSTFLAAGLPAPSLSLDAGIWGGADNPAASMVADVVQSLLPALLQNGIATEAEVGIVSLWERLQAELAEGGGVAVSPSLVGAWTAIDS
jgi:hypothetical protein